jgi:hypothetical protein
MITAKITGIARDLPVSLTQVIALQAMMRAVARRMTASPRTEPPVFQAGAHPLMATATGITITAVEGHGTSAIQISNAPADTFAQQTIALFAQRMIAHCIRIAGTGQLDAAMKTAIAQRMMMISARITMPGMKTRTTTRQVMPTPRPGT